MELKVKWQAPIDLVYYQENASIYKIENLDNLPNSSGVYIFVRFHGDSIEPLYIGKAKNLQQRIKQQLNNVSLMKSIENSKAGQRGLFLGEFQAKSGQEADKSIKIIENALIEHCLSQGYDIYNKQGTKRPVHNISFSGNRDATCITGSLIKIQKAR